MTETDVRPPLLIPNDNDVIHPKILKTNTFAPQQQQEKTRACHKIITNIFNLKQTNNKWYYLVFKDSTIRSSNTWTIKTNWFNSSEFTRPSFLSVCFQVDRSDLFLLFSQQRSCNKEFIAVTQFIAKLVNINSTKVHTYWNTNSQKVQYSQLIKYSMPRIQETL